MPIYEVAVNLPEKPHQKRGAPIAAVPGKGEFFSPVQMAAWIASGNPPPWGGVRQSRRRALRKAVARSRHWLNPALVHLDEAKERYTADRRSDSTPWAALSPEQQQAKLDEVAQMVQDANVWKDKATLLGMHSRWGFEDLKIFGIAIMNVPVTLVEDMMLPDVDLDVGPPYPQRQRLFKNSYAIDLSALSAPTLTQWDDPTVHVLPATLDPTWNDVDAWGDAKVGRFRQPRQNKRGDIIPGDST